jgi:conjugative transfer signal peptidase TraF
MIRPAVGLKSTGGFTALAWAVLPVLGAAALCAAVPQPVVLLNSTPSEPIGLYVRRTGPPQTGSIIAFRAPSTAFPYADERMSYLHRIPILKVVAAGEKDEVCTDRGELTINGHWRGSVLRQDERGERLPAWRGCRILARGEYFVFSDRVPNSFDSRYYGPIRRTSIIGVFEPLLIVNRPAGQA